MSRGNQRELARQKNQKKDVKGKNKKQGDPQSRLENDAAILRQKQLLADERKKAEASTQNKKVSYF
ncbi:hypothetical protein DASB73_020440 [Starmerella bacillaris]|uniref:Small EDRK-rich factor-like N-terminal domain-containing protein n=1 Tax=Starmerella bacillaris TaxID=1247836 RepID=A0AAV5RKE2_STABA|nr:hypothetical protein DASB73_020440 [Starmerella bacillaris]